MLKTYSAHTQYAPVTSQARALIFDQPFISPFIASSSVKLSFYRQQATVYVRFLAHPRKNIFYCILHSSIVNCHLPGLILFYADVNPLLFQIRGMVAHKGNANLQNAQLFIYQYLLNSAFVGNSRRVFFVVLICLLWIYSYGSYGGQQDGQASPFSNLL